MSYFKRLCFSSLLFIAFSAVTEAQKNDGLVSLQGSVHGIVELSHLPLKREFKDKIDIQYRKNKDGALIIKISGAGSDMVNIPIRLQIRSNIPYDLGAILNPQSSGSLSLTVLKAEKTGQLTAYDAIEKIMINRLSEKRFYYSESANKKIKIAIEAGNSEVIVLSGPKTSLAGTLTSPDNAVEIEINAEIKPLSTHQNWIASISFIAIPRQVDRNSLKY